MLGERGLEAAEKYSTAFLNRSTLSSIRDCKGGGKSIMKTTEPAGIKDGSEDVLTEGSAGEISCITHPRRKKQEQKNLWPVLCPWTSV